MLPQESAEPKHYQHQYLRTGSQADGVLDSNTYPAESPSHGVADFSRQLSINPLPISSPCSLASSLQDSRRSASPVASCASSAPAMSVAKLSNGSSASTRNGQSSRNHIRDDYSEFRRSKGASAQVLQQQNSVRQASSGMPRPLNASTVDGDGRISWPCQCGKTFTRESDRTRHSQNSTSCTYVSRVFANQGVSARRFQCKYCRKSFSRYDSMVRHQRNGSACPLAGGN
jgi:hypothetical protein